MEFIYIYDCIYVLFISELRTRFIDLVNDIPYHPQP